MPEWRITVGEERTSAVYEPARGSPTGTLFVFAHGAGGHMADRSMLAAADALRREEATRGLEHPRFVRIRDQERR